MFNLTNHVAQHPIADKAYLRHLRTADVFNEVQEARHELWEADCELQHASRRRDEAWKRNEAAKAKAAIMQALEDL